MKRFITIPVLCLTLLTSGARADETAASPVSRTASLNTVNLSFAPPLATNGWDPKDNRFSFGLVAASSASLRGVAFGTFANTIEGESAGVAVSGIYVHSAQSRGIQAAGIVNTTDSVTGMQAAGIVNVCGGDLLGGQTAGILNLTRGDVRGLQQAGILNLARNVYGIQSAGILNKAGQVEGAQSGLVNIARESAGLQTGLVNIARRAEGVQLGLLNISGENTGVPLGLLCLVRGNRPHLMTWTDESGYLLVGMRSGTEHGYSITALGQRLGTDPNGWCFALGMGVRSELGDGYLALESLMQRASENAGWQEGEFMTVKTRLVVGYPVGPVRLFAGPSVNVHMSKDQNMQKVAYWQVDASQGQDREGKDFWYAVWPGFAAGLEF